MIPLLLAFFACSAVVYGSEVTTTPSSAPPSNDDGGLKTWEIALIAGCGTLALLVCLYSVYICTRSRKPKPLGDVEVANTKAETKDVPKGTVTKDVPKGTTSGATQTKVVSKNSASNAKK